MYVCALKMMHSHGIITNMIASAVLRRRCSGLHRPPHHPRCSVFTESIISNNNRLLHHEGSSSGGRGRTAGTSRPVHFRAFSTTSHKAELQPSLIITQRIGTDEHSKVERFKVVANHSDTTSSTTTAATTSTRDVMEKTLLAVDGGQTQAGSQISFPTMLHQVTTHFLPKGYPHSVASGYKDYVLCNMAAAVLSSAGGVLSMQALLHAIGIGTVGSIPLAATLNWILKDGLGQLGGVLFASFVSNRFDIDPKKWRFLSSISLECSNFIELLTPLVPQYFLPIAALANVGKNISFLSASASRAAIHKTFAIQENLADITAKTGSQNILSSMLGTSLGISAATAIATYLDGSIYATASVFACLSSTSLLLAYRSLQSVTLTTVSVHKLEIIFEHFLQQQQTILSPAEMKEKEKYLTVAPLTHLPVLHIGSKVSSAFPNAQELLVIADLLQHRGYLLNITSNKEVHLLYKEGAEVKEMMHGILHAYLLRAEMSKTNSTNSKSMELIKSTLENNHGKYFLFNHDMVIHNDCILSHVLVGVIEGFVDRFIAEQQWQVAESILEPVYARVSTSQDHHA